MNATFWVISLLMVFVSLGLMLPSILRKPKFGAEDLRVQNVLIAKEKLKELEVELKTERISQELYAKRKEELETALLNDTEQNDTDIKEIEHSGNAAWVVAIVTPVLAVVMYLALGTSPELLQNLAQNPGASSKQMAGQTGGQQAQMSPEMMAEKIAARLEKEPNNAEGWAMLGQTFMQLKRYPDAASAFEKSHNLIPNDPQVMFRYADALAMANKSSLEGKPIELINKALKIAPRDMTGLWLSGMYAEEHGDNKKALSQWALLFEVVKGTKYEQPVMSMLTRVNNAVVKADQIDLAALSTKPVSMPSASASVSNTAAITVTVTLDDSIKAKVSPTDTVFIYAKAMSGPPMPLAAAKKQVKDLPITITLNDSMAMMPSMKLSKFQNVKIGARISKSGNAITQAGDIKQELGNVATANSSAVNLVLGGSAGTSKIAAKPSNSNPHEVTKTTVTKTAGSSRNIKLKVTLDPSLRSKVSDTDILFIYASAMSGPKMPLAVVKRQVKDLPVYIALDDSMAMMADFKLSGFDKVKVGARISKSGGVVAKEGDLFTEVTNISTDGKQPLTLNINAIKGVKK